MRPGSEYDKVIQEYEKHHAPYKGSLRFSRDQTRRCSDIRGRRPASKEKDDEVNAAAHKLAGHTEFPGLKISIENKKSDVLARI